jgi:hypothetical protein
MLADENFNFPNSIDILLGDDVFFEVHRHDKKTRPRNYYLNFAGNISLGGPEGDLRKIFFIRNNDYLDQQLQRFCEIEKSP